MRYGLALNGVYQKRNGLQPNFWDNYHQIAVTNINIPKEVTEYTWSRPSTAAVKAPIRPR